MVGHTFRMACSFYGTAKAPATPPILATDPIPNIDKSELGNNSLALINHECLGSAENNPAAPLGKRSCALPIAEHAASGEWADIR